MYKMMKNKKHPNIIIENFVGSAYANTMYSLITGPNGFPWNLNPIDVTYGENSLGGSSSKTIGFTHSLLLEGQTTEYTNLFIPLLNNIEDLVQSPCNFIRLRMSLHPKTIDSDLYNTPHVDYPYDHYSAIYYLTDSDGDTFLFDEYDQQNIFSSDKQKLNLNENFNIQTRVTPQKNKLLIFDGHQYHASSHPKESPFRIILNINFTTPQPIFTDTSGTGFKK